MATIVVTGANRGIGLELCRQLQDRGDSVIALCRQTSSALDGLGVQVQQGIDVADDGVVGLLRQRLAGRAVDVLVNNAGILTRESLEDLDFQRMRRQFEINSLGPLRVTAALLDNLQAGSKVAIITSRMGSIGDNTSGSRYGYRMSKAAVNIAGVSLARDLADRQIAVAILHPGFVRTEMTDQQGLCDPPESAAGLIARIDELTLEQSGSFWHMNGEQLPW
ncbi:MAG: SDR family oxidoreductase [Deltaproteobacteria bacterium]|nr:SDR family oxidoreductase [Deltaproteobacteria bacterium]